MPVLFPKPQQQDILLDEKTRLSPTVFRYKFHAAGAESTPFVPGQFLTFVISDTVRRSYSFASAPDSGASFELVVDLAPGGPGSQFFDKLQPGASPRVFSPLGRFTFDEDSTRTRVYVATGTGIAPFRAVLQHDARIGGGAVPPTHLYWGLRHEEDIYLTEELDGFSKLLPDFSYDIILSKPGDGWQGKRGHVTEHVLARTDLASADYYLCGNGGMIRELEAGLLAAGVPGAQIRKDAFF
jgi:CDP-4-dehydro-6-deoxyglucose reductase